jgi:hypothetical protein
MGCCESHEEIKPIKSIKPIKTIKHWHGYTKDDMFVFECSVYNQKTLLDNRMKYNRFYRLNYNDKEVLRIWNKYEDAKKKQKASKKI